MDETVIVTYSPKYRAYQKQIREQQISRALKMMEQPGRKRKGKDQNDPARFIKTTNVTKDGGYIPSYKRTDLTDDLHKAFCFHTDYEFISKSAIRSIIKGTKTEEIKNSTNRFQKGNGYSPHNFWVCSHFLLSQVSNSGLSKVFL